MPLNTYTDITPLTKQEIISIFKAEKEEAIKACREINYTQQEFITLVTGMSIDEYLIFKGNPTYENQRISKPISKPTFTRSIAHQKY